MAGNIAVVGLQWGDEGKARVIDYLTERSNFVVRFQGGSNAGHTVVAEGKKRVFHLIPSGMLHLGVQCLIGPGVALDPWSFKKEVEHLQEDLPDIQGRIQVDPGCHLVLPWHQIMDKIYEQLKGSDKLGTTGRGIGPCYSDRALRHGIRVADLFHEDHLRARLSSVLPIQNQLIEKLGGGSPLDPGKVIDDLLTIAKWLKPLVGDVPQIIMKGIHEGKSFLFEGAQSVMLDIDYGTYPYVTSSNSSLLGLHAGAGVHPQVVDEVWGITKAYCTRVGEGPFASELFGPEAERLREAGGEYGATTGRPRRCGWLDIPALKYAIETSNITALALTKLDVLSGWETVRVCTEYKGASHRIYHTDPHGVPEIEPIYQELPGWKENLDHVTRWDQLPVQAKTLVDLVERECGIPVKLITVGASREQTIPR